MLTIEIFVCVEQSSKEQTSMLVYNAEHRKKKEFLVSFFFVLFYFNHNINCNIQFH